MEVHPVEIARKAREYWETGETIPLTADEQRWLDAKIEQEIADAKAFIAEQYPDLVLPPGYDYSEPVERSRGNGQR